MTPKDQAVRSHIIYHPEIEQGSDEWLSMRCGLLTASEMKRIITPAQLKAANNDESRSHINDIAAQRITRYVEPSYISDDMLRGMNDELEARMLYDKHFEPVERVGFITNDKWGFTIGYSPDGLVGDDGLIECKSRRQKFQVETIIAQKIPTEHYIQCQTGLLVSERKWLDYISYCGGMPMMPMRVFPDEAAQAAIEDAAAAFEAKVADVIKQYDERLATAKWVPTERKIEQEITL
jgi:hypothetical protein